MADEALATYYFSNSKVTSSSARLVQIHDDFYAFSTNNIFQHLNFRQSIFFIIATFITFLQLMYQGSDKNPFSTHPNTMGVAVWASLLCYLASSGQLAFSVGRFSAASVARHCMVWSGNASVASLASVFAPDSVRPLFYVGAVLVSASELVHWVHKRILNGYRDSYFRRRWNFARLFSRIAPNSFFEPAQILPR